MMATCPKCQSLYEKDQPWKRVCLSCWLAQKNATSQPKIEVRERIVYRDRIVYKTLPADQPIPADMLRRLIQLCHPDRHGNSEASNTATRFLLQLRESAHG